MYVITHDCTGVSPLHCRWLIKRSAEVLLGSNFEVPTFTSSIVLTKTQLINRCSERMASNSTNTKKQKEEEEEEEKEHKDIKTSFSSCLW